MCGRGAGNDTPEKPPGADEGGQGHTKTTRPPHGHARQQRPAFTSSYEVNKKRTNGTAARGSEKVTNEREDAWAASGQSAKQAGVSFVGPVAVANWHINILWASGFTGILLAWKASLAASNQDTPWFASSLDCQVK